jgi:3-hydroxybutyryl-CoA dehydrogenase
MEVKDVKKVGIVGCGTMGPTIAAAVALKYPVVVKELNKELADKGFQSILQCFPALVRKNVITEVQNEVAISQISMTTDLKDLKDCQVIIDAAPDILELKISNFSDLNKICSPDTVFTTTSSLVSITALAAGSGRPDRVIGTHYNNPAHLMALVEVAPAVQTSQGTIDFIMSFLKEGLGKTPIKCKDSPGYIVNFLFFPYLIHAINALERGLGTVEEIDTAIKLGLGHRMGPFELMDMFGLDACKWGFEAIYGQLRDERYATPSTLVKLCEAGYLGRKTGKGWYIYDKQGKQTGVNKIF